MQRPKAKQLCYVLISSLKEFLTDGLIQLSMDSSSTNWSLLHVLLENREAKERPIIIIIGSCGLHVLHEALEVGMEAAGCYVGKVLKLMWQLFHDSPARRKIAPPLK